ncbi:MAG: hypothetical protein HOP29_20010 [Phycisphaerales bacterium]|nr:hypothetical protein [Phycisphaerales bacterium]
MRARHHRFAGGVWSGVVVVAVVAGCGNEPAPSLLSQVRPPEPMDASSLDTSPTAANTAAHVTESVGDSVEFDAVRYGISVSGTVYDFRGEVGGAGRAGVTVFFEGDTSIAPVVVDDDGRFNALLPPGWVGMVYPSLSGFHGAPQAVRLENVVRARTVNFSVRRRCDGINPECTECHTDGACAGADPCTIDFCDEGICAATYAPPGTPCPDGLFCDGSESCDGAGVCGGGVDPCLNHSLSACDESIDACVECVTDSDCPGRGSCHPITRSCAPPSTIRGTLVRGDGVTPATDRPLRLRLWDDTANTELSVTDAGRGTFAITVPPQAFATGLFNGRLTVDGLDVRTSPTEKTITGLIAGQNLTDVRFTVQYDIYAANSSPGVDLSANVSVGVAGLPFLRIQAAIDTALPGDAVVIRGGVYSSGTSQHAVPVFTVTPSRSGTPGRPITVRAADGESVVIHGQTGGSDTRDLVVVQGSYVNIEGLELRDARRGAVVVEAPAEFVMVRRCHAHDNDRDSSFIGGAFRAVGTVRHVTFEECMANRNSAGFEFRESPTLDNEDAHVPPRAGNIGYSHDLPESQWNAWEGWTNIASRYCVVRRCIAYDHRLLDEHSDGFKNRYGIQNYYEDNIAFDNVDDGFDGAGATRCVYRGNIAFRNDPQNTAGGDGNGIKIGVRGGLDNILIRNIAFDNRRAGIDMADTERPIVYSNTSVNNGWFGIWFEGARAGIGGIGLANNLCKGNAVGGDQGDIGKLGEINVLWSDFNGISDENNHNWAVPAGPATLIDINPQFTNEPLVIQTAFPPGLTIRQRLDFIRNQVVQKLSLRPNSPAVNRGAVIDTVTVPYMGSAPDIGAIESH